MMKTKIAVLILIVALLLISTAALAQSGGGASATPYFVAPGKAAGGMYHLTGLVWHTEGVTVLEHASVGGRYRLTQPESVSLRGSGCCCTFLPCLQKHH